MTAVFTPRNETKGPSVGPTKQPQTINNILLLLSVIATFCGRYFCASPGVLNTHTWWGSEPFSTEHLSDHPTFIHSSHCQCQCSFTHLKHFDTCSLLRQGHLTAFHFLILASHNWHRRVVSDNFELASTCNVFKGIWVLTRAYWTICLSCVEEDLRGCPDCFVFSWVSHFWTRRKKLSTVDGRSCKVCAICPGLEPRLWYVRIWAFCHSVSSGPWHGDIERWGA